MTKLNIDALARTGFLGDSPAEALNELRIAIDEHVLPFIADWWLSNGPIPSELEAKRTREAILIRRESNKLSPAYEKLPDLLSKLAGAMRFNRRNYTNIHPSPFLPAALASFIVALQNPNNIVKEVSEATTELERESIEWMAENLFGLSKNSKAWGNLTSGGTIANMTALLVARDYTYDKLNRPRQSRIGPRGVIGSTPGVVLTSAGAHYSLMKALWFLGLGHENLITVPVCWDEAMKLRNYKDERFLKGARRGPWKGRLEKAIEIDQKSGKEELKAFYAGEQCPFKLQPLNSEILKTLYSCFEFNVPLIACVLSLGTTHTGTIESLDSIAIEELHEEDVYIHVDGASAGFAFISEHVKPLLKHLDYADSFTVDPHKMGFIHYPCGAIIFRDEGFKQQIYHEAPYLIDLAPTLEGSRPGTSSAALWLATQTLGVDGYRATINHLLAFTKRLAEAFAKSGQYQVLHRVDLNAIAVAPLLRPGETRRFVNTLIDEIRKRVEQGGEFLVNRDRELSGVKVLNDPRGTGQSNEIVDIEALRIVITNPLVQFEDADRLVDLLNQYLDEEREAARGKLRQNK